MRVVAIALMLIFALPAEAQESCQYRKMELVLVDDGPTVIHVRTTRGEEVRDFGYHDSGVYPWLVYYEWCGEGWTVEYRLGGSCTYWTGEYMTAAKDNNGRAVPCEWGPWANAEFGGESPPNAPVLLAKLESLP